MCRTGLTFLGMKDFYISQGIVIIIIIIIILIIVMLIIIIIIIVIINNIIISHANPYLYPLT